MNVEYLGRMLRLLACEGVVTEQVSDGEHGARVGMYGLTDCGKLLQVCRFGCTLQVASFYIML